jgi:hypothetical protein
MPTPLFRHMITPPLLPILLLPYMMSHALSSFGCAISFFDSFAAFSSSSRLHLRQPRCHADVFADDIDIADIIISLPLMP